MKELLLSALLFIPSIAFAQESTGADAPQAAEESPQDEKAAESKNLLKPTDDLDSWVMELTEDVDGKMEVADDAIVFHVIKADDTNWHVQAYQTGLDLEEGKDYVVKFQMKATEPMEIVLMGLINEEDWHEIGLHQNVYPEKEYNDYEFEFTATDVVDGNNRVGFVLGAGEGIASVKDMTLTEAK